MPTDLFVKPAQGLKVRNPATGQPIPIEGAKVPASPYWRRRLADGDVVGANEGGKKK